MNCRQNLSRRHYIRLHAATARREYCRIPPTGRKARRGCHLTQSDPIKRRSGQAKADYKGEVLIRDWPAKGNAANYLEDRSEVRRVALQPVEDGITTFAALVKKACTINLHLLAHSTGRFIIREAFDDTDERYERDKNAKTNWSVSQICFVAADVSSKDMAETSSNSNSLYHHRVRITHYHNPYGTVLKLSNVKRIGVAPRAGRVGLPESAPAKAVGVDCGARFLKAHPTTNPVVDPISHGWYFDDPVFLKDLTFTLAGDMDRNVIPTRITTPTLRLSEK